jgi:hypothetical protein
LTVVLHRYKKNWYGRGFAIWLAVFSALGVGGAIFDQDFAGRVLYGVFAVVFAVGAYRSLRSGDLIQTEDRLIVRGVQWTHRLGRDSVRRFTVESGSLRFLLLSGSFLVAEQENGNLRPLRDFNERPGAEGIGQLEDVAAALNASWNLR